MENSVSRVGIDSRAAVQVVADSYTSMLALACAGVRDRSGGMRSPAAYATGTMTAAQFRAIARIVHPLGSPAPDCLTPAHALDRPDPGAELDRLRSMSSAELHADLDRTFHGRPPPHWEQITGDPRQWASDTADAVEAVWRRIGHVWRQQDRRRGHETDRIGGAAARGAIDVILDQACPRGRMTDGVLEFPDQAPVAVDGTGRSLVISLLLSGLDVWLANVDRADTMWFSYPVRASVVSDATGLDALLTPMRARLIRLLDRERSMTELARHLSATPPTMTYQVTMLRAAGLVQRRRDGRRIMISRTGRGAGLLDLYGMDVPRVWRARAVVHR